MASLSPVYYLLIFSVASFQILFRLVCCVPNEASRSFSACPHSLKTINHFHMQIDFSQRKVSLCILHSSCVSSDDTG